MQSNKKTQRLKNLLFWVIRYEILMQRFDLLPPYIGQQYVETM